MMNKTGIFFPYDALKESSDSFSSKRKIKTKI